MPKRPSPKKPSVSAFPMMRQAIDGTRPPFTDVSAALDNEALRKRILQEMGHPVEEKDGKSTGASKSKPQHP
jgi:hypothetical protein